MPYLGLTMSPALATGRPDGLAQGARMLAAAADAWRGIGDGAGARAAGFTSGEWRGGGARAYAGAAQTQVAFIHESARVLSQLASAIAVAAGGLDAARRAAGAALERGRQLDEQARRLEPGTLAQLLADPAVTSGLLVDGAAAERLQAEMNRVRHAMSVAEDDARHVWRSLQSACQVFAYDRPVIRSRLAAAQWDPAASVRLLAARPLPNGSSTAMDQLGLPSGGVIQGPDGRDYELVVQTALGADGRLVVSTEETPQTLRGWHQLALRFGTTDFGPKAQTWEKWAAFLGGSAGMALPGGAHFAPDQLTRLQLLPTGGAYVPETMSPPQQAAVAKSDYKLPGFGAAFWGAPQTGMARGNRSGAPDAIGLLGGVLAGGALALHLDDQRAAAYRVVFEESDQGCTPCPPAAVSCAGSAGRAVADGSGGGLRRQGRQARRYSGDGRAG